MTTTTTPKARAKAAPEEVKARMESTLKQLREAAADLPERLRGDSSELERTFAKAGDDALREVARYAIRAQHDPAALKALSAEIRKRKSELAA